jgi:hypothetical protein
MIVNNIPDRGPTNRPPARARFQPGALQLTETHSVSEPPLSARHRESGCLRAVFDINSNVFVQKEVRLGAYWVLIGCWHGTHRPQLLGTTWAPGAVSRGGCHRTPALGALEGIRSGTVWHLPCAEVTRGGRALGPTDVRSLLSF